VPDGRAQLSPAQPLKVTGSTLSRYQCENNGFVVCPTVGPSFLRHSR